MISELYLFITAALVSARAVSITATTPDAPAADSVEVCTSACFSAAAEDAGYVPSADNLQAREEFQERRLGIFIHWGIYSGIGRGEWHLSVDKPDSCEYKASALTFNPTSFDARAWASAFADAGAGYVTFTSRHHDGFSMFDTAQTDFDIVSGTPFGRDILGELTSAVKEQGMRMHYYYSLIDWLRPDYPYGSSGIAKPAELASYDHYLEFEKAQIGELLSYGPDAFWFDGMWDQEEGFDWRLSELYGLIHSADSSCLIGNNHHRAPLEGEDFQMFERDLPCENQGGSDGTPISHLPLETCETMNLSWGYQAWDHNYKSLKEIVELLVKAVSKDANLLLNIGPTGSGELPAEAAERLRELGQWMRRHGESVNGCGSTGLPPEPWGVTTRSATRLYVHIFDPAALPSDGIIRLTLAGRQYLIAVPSAFDPIDTVISVPL